MLECTKEDLDKEVEWFESKTAELLNSHAKIIRVYAYSKQWWNEDVVEARSKWARDKSKFGKEPDQRQELKQAWNLYYCTI